jgi:hypothetical protein
VGCEGLSSVGFACGASAAGLAAPKMLVLGVDEALANMLLALVVGLAPNREDVLGLEEALFKAAPKAGVGLEASVAGFAPNRVELCDRGVADASDGLLRAPKRLDAGLGASAGFGASVEAG